MGDHLYESCKYQFSQSELFQLGGMLAQVTQNLHDLHAEKREVMKSLAAQIEAFEKKIAGLAIKINQGYEMRELEVRVILDAPKPGVKSLFRIDTGEVVREEPMTPAEMQRAIEFPGDK